MKAFQLSTTFCLRKDLIGKGYWAGPLAYFLHFICTSSNKVGKVGNADLYGISWVKPELEFTV